MRLIKFSFICFLFLSKALFAQKSYSADELSSMIVAIVNSNKIIGTGTIISDSANYYILTATHVSNSINGNCHIVFKSDNDTPLVIPLSDLTNQPKNWKNHENADISFIKLDFQGKYQTFLKQRSFPSSQILYERLAVPRDFNVISFGFPTVDNLGEHFSPLTFNSYFSSGLITLPRADTNVNSTFQLLENPSVQGYSGGPVLISVKKNGLTVGLDRTMIVGIMHGTFKDNTGGKLAMVTHSSYLKKFLR